MEITIIAVGKQMPTWINTGFQEFATRLPREYKLNFIEVTPSKRLNNSSITDLKNRECRNILSHIPPKAHIVLLDEHGKHLSTKQLADQLQRWKEQLQQIYFVIGGADGLADELKQRAQFQWSLSALTFPHALVRVLLIEQLYRAHSLLQNHPYHRE
jgi:23S rRNA (pseudouridine1915-N3)-methyltransferase